ncbi:MAG TPA: protease modulator HflC [Verrucomicrobiae bacterium]|nr:protease modulator HflC [Verrucomicrobiae bacterium]
MKRNPLIYVISALVAIIVLLMLFTFQVRQSEVAVVTTFGKPTRVITEPGFHLRLPWGIQMVHRLDQRVQNFQDPLTQGLTRDSYNLLTSVYVGWKITQPSTFYPQFAGSADPIAEAEKHLAVILSNDKLAVVGNHLLSDFLSNSSTGANFAGIEQEILAAARKDLQSLNYGLEIEFLGIKKLELPESVTQTVFDRMTSERKVLADQSQYEGEAEAQKIRSEADRKSAEMITAAQSKATEIRGLGEAEAAKSLAVFQKNPDLANFIFRLNALDLSLKDRSILVFDRHTPPFDLFSGISTNLTYKK